MLLLLCRLLDDPILSPPVGVTGVTREGEGTIGVSNFESIGSVICRTKSSFGRLGRGEEVGLNIWGVDPDPPPWTLSEDPVGDIREGPMTCRADQLLSILILLAEVTEEWLEPVEDVSLFIKLA